tara:strand:+ start:5407 stop:6342 length:936 start_codon:yes stop_codon:yes gene_type:complete
MIAVVKYCNDLKEEWNNLNNRAKNGSFLFNRDYMDYHSNRFKDLSFVIYRKNKIHGILPGNTIGNTYYSHQGLTYGGLIYTNKISTKDVIEIFNQIIQLLKIKKINEIIYKPSPYIFHNLPSQEDIYAIFLLKASKIGCTISSCIDLENKIKFIESRKSGIRKAISNHLMVEESSDFSAFWEILNENLKLKFQKKPVHTIDEINKLYDKFPSNIKLYVAKKDQNIIAGTIIYIINKVAHVQYISANNIGKQLGALDLIFDRLINEIFNDFKFFDFGHSNEKMGFYINEDLIFQKEGFGARGVVSDIYKILL